MKTAISLPTNVFQDAERFARQTNKSRSQLYRLALQEYMARHTPDRVTEAMNRVCVALGMQDRDDFPKVAARRILKRSEW